VAFAIVIFGYKQLVVAVQTPLYCSVNEKMLLIGIIKAFIEITNGLSAITQSGD